MRLMSWNVNGLRAILKKNFLEFLDAEKPDVLCLQEIKARPDQVDFSVPGYEVVWNPAKRPGYSGTMTLTRVSPDGVRLGMGKEEHDSEGRVIVTEYRDFQLVNVYTPNAQDGLRRLDYRIHGWDVCFREFLKGLDKRKPVIFCGDLNVAHKEIDLARPGANHQSPGFTDAERESFSETLAAGFVDSFRAFHDEPGRYSWWSYRGGARKRNVGWRIDYFCVSEQLAGVMRGAEIHQDVLGSDHCPVSLDME